MCNYIIESINIIKNVLLYIRGAWYIAFEVETHPCQKLYLNDVVKKLKTRKK
jgi:hypothetical protein